MKLWIVETFKDGKWRLLCYSTEDGYHYPIFDTRKEARDWKWMCSVSDFHYNTKFRIRRVELPGVAP